MIKVVIPLRPTTKKNNPQVYCISGCRGWHRGCGRPQPKKIVIPSAEFIKYQKEAEKYFWEYGNICFDDPVHVKVCYWMPDRRSKPDLSGILQGVGDLLQHVKLIANDSLIESWDGSRFMGVDKVNFRTEIFLELFKEG